MNQIIANNNNKNQISKTDLISILVEKAEVDPFENITVKEVAKDLRVGENKANEIFRREDFPSVNIGKTKTVKLLAYWLWKMERRNENE